MDAPPPPRPIPPDEELPEERRGRRQNRWLLLATVIALLAAGAAAYAISEIESTKDANREDDAAVDALRADLEALREETTDRLDTVEGRVDDAADAQTQRRLENSLEEVQQQVRRLNRQDGDDEDLSSRLDDLEQRVEELEQEAD